MEIVLFIITSLVALVSAILVVTQRKPVSSALFLVLAFFCLAVLYIMLGAEFIAVLQVIVYAGAIMVLFVFVVMLLNLRGKQSWDNTGSMRTLLGFGAAGLIMVITVPIIQSSVGASSALGLSEVREMQQLLDSGGELSPAQTAEIKKWLDNSDQENRIDATTPAQKLKVIEDYYLTMGSVETIGENLFKRFLLPFEVASVLLLAAIIGVVAMLKRKNTASTPQTEGGEE